MRDKFWKVTLLNWVLLAAAANSTPTQPNWKIAGNFGTATDCVAAIGENLAAKSVMGGIASWASSEMGTASGTTSNPPSNVTPLVCVPANHPWATSLAGAAPSGQGQSAPPNAQPTH
jgi:hypothetical protein